MNIKGGRRGNLPPLLRPLGVCQYESLHPELESQPSHRWNPDSQQALEHDPEKWKPIFQKIMLKQRE
jgi:hypothetical protein